MSKYHARRQPKSSKAQNHQNSQRGQKLNPDRSQAANQVSRPSHLGFWAMLALTLLIMIAAAVLYSFNVLPHRQYTNEDFGIMTYQSPVDHDHDGIDDQSDILQNVRAYLATDPKYKSAYYANGYPDDGYGVCTDVVAIGLKGAGYDLMELVDADIKQAPEEYDVETPDKNIDFRRVNNLTVYLKRHALELTTNLQQIQDWQGGDIVVFRDHIGVVSDKRNRRGVPFLLHHYSPFQVTYEEDVLENYDQEEIVGHFRIS